MIFVTITAISVIVGALTVTVIVAAVIAMPPFPMIILLGLVPMVRNLMLDLISAVVFFFSISVTFTRSVIVSVTTVTAMTAMTTFTTMTAAYAVLVCTAGCVE